MQNLLRFARGTDSPAEAVLFIRYQAARARPDERRFLVPLADQAEQHYGGDIDALRTFLGILVRAAQVTRAQAWQDASAPGPGRQAERR